MSERNFDFMDESGAKDEVVRLDERVRELEADNTRLSAELETVTRDRDDWADYVTVASGGHARTPQQAADFITTLRNMLDYVKAENARLSAKEADDAK